MNDRVKSILDSAKKTIDKLVKFENDCIEADRRGDPHRFDGFYKVLQEKRHALNAAYEGIRARQIKQAIIIPDKISPGIFNLPVVTAVIKGDRLGRPIYKLKYSMLVPRDNFVTDIYAEYGDILCELHDGRWEVMPQAKWEQLKAEEI